MTELEELQKLAERLRQIVKKYEAKNPLRTADFHGDDCSCYRCAVDACDAAVNALPELIAMARENERLREALAEIARCNQYMSEADTSYEYEMRQIELCRLIKTRTALKEKPQ